MQKAQDIHNVEIELVSRDQSQSPPPPQNSDQPTQRISDSPVVQSLHDEDEPYQTPSFIINPAHIPKNQEKLVQTVRGMKLFPIFEDHQLAKSSINYFLYLEFYHVGIRLFLQILLFSMIFYAFFFAAGRISSTLKKAYARVIAYTVGGVLATFLMKHCLKKENKRLLDHDGLYHFQWSEDLFSLLLTNIPKLCTKLEIKQYLQSILQKKQSSLNATVRDIIYVHDYYEFTRLSKALKSSHDKLTALKTQPSNEKTIQKRRSLQQKTTMLKSKLSLLQEEIQDFKHFRGKVIVVFNTIEAKGLILQHFAIGKFKSMLIFLFKLCYKSYYLKGQRISYKEIPEPHNLLIENLHYPLHKRVFRTPLAYLVSTIVFIIALITLGAISGWKLYTVVQNTESLLNNVYYSYGLAILTMLLSTLLRRLYKKTQRLFIYSSALRAEISMVNYNIYVALLLYVLIQGILGYGNRDLWIDQLIKLALLDVLKRLVLKGFATCTALIKPKDSKESESLLAGLLQKAKRKYIEFDFAQGLAYAFPIIFMGLAFIILNPFVLLPIFIIALYIYAVIDKYRMLRQCNLYSTKSARFMLVHFWIYSWAPLLASVATIGILLTYEKQVYPKAEQKPTFAIPMLICVVGLIFSLCSVCCGKSLDQRVADKFFERNSKVKYDSVSKEFSSFYQREDYSEKHFIV